jgi:two-component system chemotaxis response regulator CheB
VRALVIDDSKPVRCILAQMLRELDFDTTEAANGQEGLDRIRDIGKPDIATVNWHMPKMDGLEFIRTVRADARLRGLPLLMISGESDPAQIATALAAGANDYIVKPCTRRTLIGKLGKLGICLASDLPSEQATAAAPVFRDAPKIRVLIVDDSVVVRRVISSALDDDPDLEVAGTAADGVIALQRLDDVNPDVVLLDVEMPNLDGLETLKSLRKSHPRLPVIMFSSLTERGAAVTTDALLLGADDYVAKPGGTHMKDVSAGKQAIQELLIPKIKLLSLRNRQAGGMIERTDHVRPTLARQITPACRIDVVVIAASTGGPCALAAVLAECGVECPVPILVVQHMPPIFTKHLANRLSDGGKRDVREGVDGDLLGPGQVRVAPGGFHMAVAGRADLTRLKLNLDAPVNSCRPSADILFQSVADVYGNAVLAVVLTGMGCDGLIGCKRLHQAGAQILAQDEETSVVWGMPGQVARAGIANDVLPLERMGPEIVRRLRLRR